MPIFEEPTEPLPRASNPDVSSRAQNILVADSRAHKFEALSMHVSGFKWIVTYYRQYVGEDSETASLDTQVAPVFQQYLRIKNMEFRVTDPLTASQDANSAEFTYSGAAICYAGFIPNVGDHFTAEVADGKIGLFHVTGVEQPSISKSTVYSFQYDMMEFLGAERKEDLESKVVKDTFYVKDFVALGREPLLLDTEYNQYQTVIRLVNTLPVEYFKQFYVSNHTTLLLPDQPVSTYDPHVLATMRLMAPDSAYALFSKITAHNVQSTTDSNRTTLWDVIRERNERGLDFVANKMNPQSVNYYKWAHYFGGIHYSGIQRVIMPPDSKVAIDVGLELNPSVEVVLSRPKPVVTPPLVSSIKLVTHDDFYVLSQAFYYQEVDNMSVLERLITNHILGTSVSITDLLKVCDESAGWGALERFYYMPILLVLLNHAYMEIN